MLDKHLPSITLGWWGGHSQKHASVVFLCLALAKARANFSHVEVLDEIPVPSNETFILPPAHYDSNKLVISS